MFTGNELCHRLPRGANTQRTQRSREDSRVTCMGRNRSNPAPVTAQLDLTGGGSHLNARPPREAEVPPPTSKVSRNGEKFWPVEGMSSPDERASGPEEEYASS